METTQIKEHLRSRFTRNVMTIVAVTLLVIAAFWAGMEVGFVKAAFSYRFGDSYYGAFGPKDMRRSMGYIPNDISSAHGVSGKVVSVHLPTLVVADNDNVEKVVRVTDDTVIRKLRDTISAKDLTPGDFVVVIGSPTAGTEVAATFIRVLPPPPGAPAVPGGTP